MKPTTPMPAKRAATSSSVYPLETITCTSGLDLLQLLEGLLAAHVRHGHIRKHNTNLIGTLAEHLDSVPTVGGPEDGKTVSFQHIPDDRPDALLVVDKQYRTGAFPMAC